MAPRMPSAEVMLVPVGSQVGREQPPKDPDEERYGEFLEEPDNALFHNGLGRVYLRLSRYEAAWAAEVIVFVRILEASGLPNASQARVQISPDGIHWCDEGTRVDLTCEQEVTFAKVTHFGGFIRLAGELPPGVELRVLVYLSLKA